MKFTRKTILNSVFIVIIGLLIYPPTKVYFIRLISFAPSTINIDERKELENYQWNLKGLNTNNIDFSQTKGKVVFVSFWATWCPPCRAEMPSIQHLYDAYKDRVAFILVSDEKWKTIDDFYKKNGYDLPTYNSLNNRPALLNSQTIPATFILDKNGAIVMQKRGAADWNSTKVRELLDQLIK